MKYIILNMDDVAEIMQHLPNGRIKDRLEAETDADIQEIVDNLKSFNFCCACVIEGQQSSCIAPYVNKVGQRLRRLIERADAK